MAALHNRIRRAIQLERFVIGWHADEQCEIRGISPWQLAAEFDQAVLLLERPASKPNPSVLVRQILADGNVVRAVWAWLSHSQRAKLVTVFFEEPTP